MHIMTGSQKMPSLKASRQVESQIVSILEKFSKLVSKRDADGVLKLFGTDEDVISIGSEAAEIAIGRKEIKNFLNRVLSRAYTFSWKWDTHLVSAKDSTAWVFSSGSVVKTKNGKHETSPYRLSAVFEKRDGKWVLMQYHGSEPA